MNGEPVQSYRSLSEHPDRKAREKGVPIFGEFELTRYYVRHGIFQIPGCEEPVQDVPTPPEAGM